MHLLKYYFRFLLHISNQRVHLQKGGYKYRYGINCYHAEMKTKGFFKISKYKIFELLISRYKVL